MGFMPGGDLECLAREGLRLVHVAGSRNAVGKRSDDLIVAGLFAIGDAEMALGSREVVQPHIQQMAEIVVIPRRPRGVFKRAAVRTRREVVVPEQRLA